jgi:hypothetical protein
MDIEIYQNEGRFIVMGFSKHSPNGDSFVAGQSAEPEKQSVFFDAFKIGPKPTNGFW